MKLQSYWHDTMPPFLTASQDVVSGQADVVIVGGGFTGLSAAVALRRKGKSVVLLEAGRVVGQASGRNGGHCSAGLAHDFSALAKKIGRPMATEMYKSYSDAVETVERLVSEESIDCDFRRCGKLKVASKPEHFAKLQQVYRDLSPEIDPHLSLVAPADIASEIGGGEFHGGLLQSSSAQMHVGKFGIGLAHAAVRHGARIYEAAPVTELKRIDGQAYRVTCAKGSILAKQVLLATGGCAVGPLGWFRRRLIPIGSFVIATEVLSQEVIDKIMPGRRNYVTSMNVGHYFRLSPDNRLLFGGRARFAISNPESDKKSGVILQAAMIDMFPILRDTRIDYCWGGTVDVSADRLPRAGTHKGMFFSTAYSGHGVQMSIHMGQLLAEMMAGDTTINPWRELKWPPIPGHFGKPWFLPLVGAYYKMRDRFS